MRINGMTTQREILKTSPQYCYKKAIGTRKENFYFDAENQGGNNFIGEIVRDPIKMILSLRFRSSIECFDAFSNFKW